MSAMEKHPPRRSQRSQAEASGELKPAPRTAEELPTFEVHKVAAECRREKPADESKLGFGQVFSDHMFVMEYLQGHGWRDHRIEPYGSFLLDPAAMVLHYGQE